MAILAVLIAVACVAFYKAGHSSRRRIIKVPVVTKTQAVSLALLLLFACVVVMSTIFTRLPAGNIRYKFTPLWSWHAVLTQGNKTMLKQIVLNCVLLFPLGFFLPFVRGRKLNAGKAVFAGLIFSLCIELAQLFTHRGIFDFDDILHNAIGCFAGCVFANLLRDLFSTQK